VISDFFFLIKKLILSEIVSREKIPVTENAKKPLMYLLPLPIKKLTEIGESVMKRIFLVFLILLNIIVFSDIRMETNAQQAADMNLLVESGDAYVVYKDGSSVYFVKGTSDFLTWSTPYRIALFSSVGEPDIVKNGNNIYVFFTGKKDANDPNKRIYYSVSSNNGMSFSAPVVFFPGDAEKSTYDCSEVKIKGDSSGIGVVFIASTTGNPIFSNVYFASGTYAGITSLTDLLSSSGSIENITNSFTSAYDSLISSLSLDITTNGDYNVCFEREYNQILNCYYWNESMSGSDAAAITNTQQDITGKIFNSLPFMKASGSDINVLFQDITSGVNKIAYVKSSDAGTTWNYSIVQGPINGNINYPQLIEVGSELYAFWVEDVSGTLYPKYKKYSLTTWDANVYNLSTEFSPYGAKYFDFADGTDRAYYVYAGENNSERHAYFSFSSLSTSGGSTSGLPTVVSKYPSPDSTNVDLGAGVRVEFSTSMNTSTFTSTNIQLNVKNTGASVPATITATTSNVVILNPSSNFNSNTEYRVSVSGCLDSNGNQVVPTTWDFSTGAQDSSSTGSITKAISYPNPFRGGVFKFNYSFTRPAQSVKIKVYDMRGKLVTTIRPIDITGTSSEAIWDLFDKHGNSISNGIYIYKIIADFGNETTEKEGKIIIAR